MSDNVSGKKRRRDEEVLSGDDEEWAESVGSNDRLEGADDLSDEGSFQDEPPAKTRKAKVEGADDLSDEGSFEDEPPPKDEPKCVGAHAHAIFCARVCVCLRVHVYERLHAHGCASVLVVRVRENDE